MLSAAISLASCSNSSVKSASYKTHKLLKFQSSGEKFPLAGVAELSCKLQREGGIAGATGGVCGGNSLAIPGSRSNA